MIFNEMNTNDTISYESVQESAHELGIGGALMHVYENECNYNALMKAAALSELKYYNENGGDLFVQEAGAFAGFMGKIKAFFLKVIEKIKSICKKFVAKINQFTMKDKDFVKKYASQLQRMNLEDFEFEGYAFPALDKDLTNTGKAYTSTVSAVKTDSTSDDITKVIESNRGDLIGGSAMEESEFRSELKEFFYGDKDTIEVGKLGIMKFLRIIEGAKDAIKKAEKAEKDITNEINKAIKEMDKNAKKHTDDARDATYSYDAKCRSS